MMILFELKKYFIWINEFKNKYSLQRHSASQYVTENQ